MDVRAPELLAVDVERAAVPQIARELVDRQVEAHPLGDAVDRGETQAGGIRQRSRRAGRARPPPSARRRARPARAAPSRPSGPAGRPCGRSSSTSRRTRCARRRRRRGHERVRASTLTVWESSGSLAQAGSPTIAARCTTASAPSSASRRARASRTSPRSTRDAGVLERRGDLLLAVQQRVERRHLVPAPTAARAPARSADVAGAAGDRDPHERDATLTPAGMTHSLPVFALRRLFAAALLAVAVSALTFVTLHGLYPEAFNDTRPLLVECAHFLFATFVQALIWATRWRVRSAHRRGAARARPGGRLLAAWRRTRVRHRGRRLGRRRVRAPSGDVAGADPPGGSRCWRCARPSMCLGMSAILLFKPGIDAPFPIGILPYHGYIPLTENPLKWLHSLVVPWIVAGAAAGCSLPADDAREHQRDPRRGLHPHRRCQGPLRRRRSRVAMSSRWRCRPSSRWPAPTRRC